MSHGRGKEGKRRTPPFHEVLGNVEDGGTDKHRMNVMPRHARRLEATYLVRSPHIDVLEVVDLQNSKEASIADFRRDVRRKSTYPSIVVVLSGEERAGEVGGVNVRERVRSKIPSSEAEVESADAGHDCIDDDNLLVMAPVEDDFPSASGRESVMGQGRGKGRKGGKRLTRGGLGGGQRGCSREALRDDAWCVRNSSSSSG